MHTATTQITALYNTATNEINRTPATEYLKVAVQGFTVGVLFVALNFTAFLAGGAVAFIA